MPCMVLHWRGSISHPGMIKIIPWDIAAPEEWYAMIAVSEKSSIEGRPAHILDCRTPVRIGKNP
jgi:hypothetical protein